MASVTCFRYAWHFPDGVTVGTKYYGYIDWNSAPLLPLQGAVSISAAPSGPFAGKITVLDFSVFGPGLGTSGVSFTVRNDGNDTIRDWDVFLSIILP